MAKYGLFYTGVDKPAQVYAGDYMTQDKQFVQIYSRNPYKGDQQVAAIHLDAGYSVKLIQN